MIVELTKRGGMQKAEDKKEGPPPKVPPPTHRSDSFNRPLPEKFNVRLFKVYAPVNFMDSAKTRKIFGVKVKGGRDTGNFVCMIVWCSEHKDGMFFYITLAVYIQPQGLEFLVP